VGRGWGGADIFALPKKAFKRWALGASRQFCLIAWLQWRHASCSHPGCPSPSPPGPRPWRTTEDATPNWPWVSFISQLWSVSLGGLPAVYWLPIHPETHKNTLTDTQTDKLNMHIYKHIKHTLPHTSTPNSNYSHTHIPKHTEYSPNIHRYIYKRSHIDTYIPKPKPNIDLLC
jgi:hypothetical protein